MRSKHMHIRISVIAIEAMTVDLGIVCGIETQVNE